MTPPRAKGKARLLPILLLAAGVPLLGGCGGSSSAPTSSTTATTVDTVQSAAVESTARPAGHRRPDPIRHGDVVKKPLHGTGGAEINDDNPSHADTGGHSSTAPSNPCRLVSRAEAQKIVGGPVASPVEAPLGPTCIYRPLHGKQLITVSVQATNLPAVKRALRHPTQATVAGHPAYCGVYGQATTYVPLPSGGVLDITGPCSIGIRFAETALPRLS